MDERKVSQYPMVDFSSPSGMRDGALSYGRRPNPIVRIFVASPNGGEPRAMDTGAETDIYIPRVSWLTDSKHLAIQRLNRTQTTLDLLIAEAATGKTRAALSENDPNWINVSDDLYSSRTASAFCGPASAAGIATCICVTSMANNCAAHQG